MDSDNSKTADFERFIALHRRIIAKVCWLYASDENSWQDMHQEVLINLWRGFGSFAGEAKSSTWVWRVALNTCISDMRRNRRHRGAVPLPAASNCCDDDTEHTERLRELHELISRLGHLERTIMMMWLDEYTYDEIASVTGLSRNNVASRLHRIKEKLTKMAKQ